MVGLGANKGPGLTSRMPYIRAEGHWVTQGLGACGLAWLTMQTFNKEWNNKEMVFLGFPAGLSGKESACQSRRHGFDPRSGKIPYAEEQLSSYATTTEPVLHGPHSLQLEKSPSSNEDPAQQKKKKKSLKKKKWYSRMINLEAMYRGRLVKESHP